MKIKWFTAESKVVNYHETVVVKTGREEDSIYVQRNKKNKSNQFPFPSGNAAD